MNGPEIRPLTRVLLSHTLCLVEFIETTLFTRRISELVADDDYAKFQTFLSANPENGDLIKNAGGVRKIRLATEGRGKSGGARVIYYFLKNHETIYLLYIYTKGEADNLSEDGKKTMRALTRQIREQHHD